MTLIVASTNTFLRSLQTGNMKKVESECLINTKYEDGTSTFNCNATSNEKPKAVGSNSDFTFYKTENDCTPMENLAGDNVAITAQAYEDATNLIAITNTSNFVILNGEVNSKSNSFIISGSLDGDKVGKS